MSTKSTIRHGEKWHLYRECFENDSVYLDVEDIEIQFNSCGINNNVTVRLSNKQALDIGLITKKRYTRKP